MSDDSNSSDSRDELEDNYPTTKKQRLVVFESPPDSPTSARSPSSPNFKPILNPTGSWEDFETLVEMAEFFYKRENSKDKETLPSIISEPDNDTPLSMVSAQTVNYPISEATDYASVTNARLPLKIAIPEYDFGIRALPRAMPLSPTFSYWRSL
jgi:hypothetical protein